MRAWLQWWRRSASPAESIAAFRIDETPDDPLDEPVLADFLEELYANCAAALRHGYELRAAGRSAETLRREVQSARQGAGRLMTEVEQIKDELAGARREMELRNEHETREREALLCRLAGEVFRFQQALHHFEARGLNDLLGKEYDRVRILMRRMERLLQQEGVLLLDPTNREPDGEQMDVLDYVTRPDIEKEVVVNVLEPIVVHQGHVIGRAKVVVGLPATE
jgi:molecular chaperone GrpE (heat shock protein)